MRSQSAAYGMIRSFPGAMPTERVHSPPSPQTGTITLRLKAAKSPVAIGAGLTRQTSLHRNTSPSQLVWCAYDNLTLTCCLSCSSQSQKWESSAGMDPFSYGYNSDTYVLSTN